MSEVLNFTEDFRTSTTISAKQVYKSDRVAIPDGYRFAAFRRPREGEYYLHPGSGTASKCDFYDPLKLPLLVLERVPTFRFVADGEQPRVPKRGDWVAVSTTNKNYATCFKKVEFDWQDHPENKHLVFRRETQILPEDER